MSRRRGLFLGIVRKGFQLSGQARHALLFAVFAILGATGAWTLLSEQGHAAVIQEARQAEPALQARPNALPSVAGNAHCRCEITCRAADGRTFTRANSPFPGYTQGLESERNRCQSSCNQWVGSSIQSWAEQENICGGLQCSGTSHVGNEPSNRWKNVQGASHHRTCCPPASNGQGCPPVLGTDITSVFRIVPSGNLTAPYRLLYSSYMNTARDTAFQAWANLVRTQRPTMTHAYAGYRIDHMSAPNTWTQISWFAVRYNTPSMAGGTPGAALLAPLFQVNQTYRVTQGWFYKNAQDQDLPHYGDPSCVLPSFTIRISVTSLRSGASAQGAPRAMATISVAGQPDREVAIMPETPVEREERLRIERDSPRMEQPNLRLEAMDRPRPPQR